MKRLAILVLVVLAVGLPMGAWAHTQDSPMSSDLIAGQHTDVGDVLVWNDSEALYVTIAGRGWCIGEAHLHVATSLDSIPQARGNPIPGRFEHKREGECTPGASKRVSLGSWGVGTTLYIAAHAEVYPWIDSGGSCCPCPPCGDLCDRCDCSGEGETAWGAGSPFPGANWATYITYVVQ